MVQSVNLIFNINPIFDILLSDKSNHCEDAERYVIAATYLLLLKHNRTLDEVENIDFEVHEIMDSIGCYYFGWGINTAISEFVKKYRIK